MLCHASHQHAPQASQPIPVGTQCSCFQGLHVLMFIIVFTQHISMFLTQPDITLCPAFPFLFPSVLLPDTEVCNHSFFIFLLYLYPTVPSFHARLDTFLLYSSPT